MACTYLNPFSPIPFVPNLRYVRQSKLSTRDKWTFQAETTTGRRFEQSSDWSGFGTEYDMGMVRNALSHVARRWPKDTLKKIWIRNERTNMVVRDISYLMLRVNE